MKTASPVNAEASDIVLKHVLLHRNVMLDANSSRSSDANVERNQVWSEAKDRVNKLMKTKGKKDMELAQVKNLFYCRRKKIMNLLKEPFIKELRYRRDETGGGIEYEKEDEFEKQDTVEFENNLDKQLAAILEASPATNGINDSTETRPTFQNKRKEQNSPKNTEVEEILLSDSADVSDNEFSFNNIDDIENGSDKKANISILKNEVPVFYVDEDKLESKEQIHEASKPFKANRADCIQMDYESRKSLKRMCDQVVEHFQHKKVFENRMLIVLEKIDTKLDDILARDVAKEKPSDADMPGMIGDPNIAMSFVSL